MKGFFFSEALSALRATFRRLNVSSEYFTQRVENMKKNFIPRELYHMKFYVIKLIFCPNVYNRYINKNDSPNFKYVHNFWTTALNWIMHLFVFSIVRSNWDCIINKKSIQSKKHSNTKFNQSEIRRINLML